MIDEADLNHIWQNSKLCLQELDNASLFITGGTGFFGCWLLESLRFAQINHQLKINIVVLTRDPLQFFKKAPHLADMHGLKLIKGDVINFEFPEEEFTHIIHAATEASAKLNQEQPLVMLDTLIYGTRRVLEFAKYSKAKKVLLTSSGAVYGPQPRDLLNVDESFNGVPCSFAANSSYGIGKRLSEHLCNIYTSHFDLDIKIARCFAFVGPYLPLTTHFAIGNFIYNAIHKKPIQIAGDGTPMRSYLYAADLTLWLWHILCFGKKNHPYNVGSEDAISIRDLATCVAKQVAEPILINVAKEPNLHELPERYIPSTKRAFEELGLKQYIALDVGIKKTIDWGML